MTIADPEASTPRWRIAPTAAQHAEALAELQRIVFPTLDPSERFGADHYRRHVEIFPGGQFVALDDGRPETPIAATTTLRLNLDLEHPQHRFPEFLGGLSLSAHDPAGEWLYGADLGVHPAWRRRGIARALYAARQSAAVQLGLRGQLTVGMLNGYGAVADRMSAEEYYERLVAGVLEDPTVSAQLRIGFRPGGLIPDYVQDPRCGGYGVLLTLPGDHPVPAREPSAERQSRAHL